MPESVKPNDLDRGARGELRTLSKENADEVARHLVMAGRLVEDDPAEAHRHALAAARRAGRVAVVRESLAITAYATGDFALALRELRTFRRISGSDDQIGLMVDSERGVGRPDRALELGRSVDRSALPLEAQVALAIAMSGARLDLQDPRGALDELERAPLDLQRVHPWSSTLYESLAAVHEDLGDAEEAERWRRRAERADELLDQVDEEGSTVDVSTEIDPDRVVQQQPEDGVEDRLEDDGLVDDPDGTGPTGIAHDADEPADEPVDAPGSEQTAPDAVGRSASADAGAEPGSTVAHEEPVTEDRAAADPEDDAAPAEGAEEPGADEPGRGADEPGAGADEPGAGADEDEPAAAPAQAERAGPDGA